MVAEQYLEKYYEKIQNFKNLISISNHNSDTYFLKLLEFIEKYSNINTCIFRNSIRTGNSDNEKMELELNDLLCNLMPILLKSNQTKPNKSNINIEFITEFTSKIIYDNLPNKKIFEKNNKMVYRKNNTFVINNFKENSFILKDNRDYILKINKEFYYLDLQNFFENLVKINQLFDDFKQIIDNNEKLIEIEIDLELEDWIKNFDINDKFDIEKYKNQIGIDISEKIKEKEVIIIKNLLNCILYEIHFLIENIKGTKIN